MLGVLPNCHRSGRQPPISRARVVTGSLFWTARTSRRGYVWPILSPEPARGVLNPDKSLQIYFCKDQSVKNESEICRNQSRLRRSMVRWVSLLNLLSLQTNHLLVSSRSHAISSRKHAYIMLTPLNPTFI